MRTSAPSLIKSQTPNFYLINPVKFLANSAPLFVASPRLTGGRRGIKISAILKDLKTLGIMLSVVHAFNLADWPPREPSKSSRMTADDHKVQPSDRFSHLGAWSAATEGMNVFFFCHRQIKGTIASSTHTEQTTVCIFFSL